MRYNQSMNPSIDQYINQSFGKNIYHGNPSSRAGTVDSFVFLQLKAAQAGFFVRASRCVSASVGPVAESTDDVVPMLTVRIEDDIETT